MHPLLGNIYDSFKLDWGHTVYVILWYSNEVWHSRPTRKLRDEMFTQKWWPSIIFWCFPDHRAPITAHHWDQRSLWRVRDVCTQCNIQFSMQDINFQLSTSSFGLRVVRQLTDNLDFEARGGFASLILQDYLVIASVLPLCDINSQACLVAIRFSTDPVTSLKNHLGTSVKHEYWIQIKRRNLDISVCSVAALGESFNTHMLCFV